MQEDELDGVRGGQGAPLIALVEPWRGLIMNWRAICQGLPGGGWGGGKGREFWLPADLAKALLSFWWEFGRNLGSTNYKNSQS